MAINIFQEKQSIRKSISDYFGNLVMTKLKKTDPTENKPSYSIYYAKIGCMLCVDDRYVIAIVESDPYPIGSQEYLSEMNWISFQTRTIEQPLSQLKTQQTKSVMTRQITDKIHLQEKTQDRNVYMASTLPLKIELLYTTEDDNYSNSGTIQSALDTYNCVLSFTV